MTFSETLLATLIVAAITALAIIAYRHPAGYKTIARYLITLTLGFAVAIILFELGRLQWSTEVMRKVLEESPDLPIRSLASSITRSYDAVVTIGRAALFVGAVEAYLALLWWLPQILGHEADDGGQEGVQAATKRLIEVLERIEQHDKPVQPTQEQNEKKIEREP